ncbi:MAG: aldo/keto reductase [Pirellulaceae bacterium]
MKTLTLPGADLTVSQLVFGCWGITSDFHWGSRDEADSLAAIHAALDAGVNFFDTAAAYGDGNSERLLGKALAGRRDQVVIASKATPGEMDPRRIPTACEQSLERLGVDYLDLYQTHWANPDFPLADSWGALVKLQQQGKVRHIGVCNAGVGHLAEVSAVARPATNQLPYNLLWRMIERQILPKCRELNLPVLVYSPLMHGLLSGKYRSAADVPDGMARSRHFNTERKLARHGEPGCEEETFAAITAIDAICRSLGRPMAEVALNWVAQQPGVSCVIAGARTPEQLAQNVATLDNPLSDDALQQLNEATAALDRALGPNPDMWDGGDKSRFQ